VVDYIGHFKTGLTGGTSDDLDSIDGAELDNTHIALVMHAGVFLTYKLYETSGAEADPPLVIAPVQNAGLKRWILQGVNYVSGLIDDMDAGGHDLKNLRRIGVGTGAPQGPVEVGVFSETGASNGYVFTEGTSQRKSSCDITTPRAHLYFYNPNGAVGSIITDGSQTTYATSSDYRLKENETPILTPCDKLLTLPVYEFNFKSDPSKRVTGFFAHELQEIIPEAATGTKDEVDGDGNPVYQGVDQSKVVPLLTAAVQDLISTVKSLEERIAVFEEQG